MVRLGCQHKGVLLNSFEQLIEMAGQAAYGADWETKSQDMMDRITRIVTKVVEILEINEALDRILAEEADEC